MFPMALLSHVSGVDHQVWSGSNLVPQHCISSGSLSASGGAEGHDLVSKIYPSAWIGSRPAKPDFARLTSPRCRLLGWSQGDGEGGSIGRVTWWSSWDHRTPFREAQAGGSECDGFVALWLVYFDVRLLMNTGPRRRIRPPVTLPQRNQQKESIE